MLKISISKILVTLLFISISFISFAQTEEVETAEDKVQPFEISGSADLYFRTNLNGENLQSNSGYITTIAPYSSFANTPGFSLGMINLIGKYNFKSTSLVADLGFGPRAQDASFTSIGSTNIINQLYVSVDVSEKVSLTFGKFNTFLGYEVISPTGNYNYSTSYLFSNGPFSHTGLKADIDLGSGLSLMAAIMNPTDFTTFNPSDEYVGGLQLGYSVDKGSVYLNGIVSDGFYQLDITTGFDVTEKTYVGLNGSIAQDAFSGLALYVQQELKSNLSLGLRAERFIPEDGTANTNFTLSAQYEIGNLKIIPEIRIDTADSEYFLTEDPLENTDNLSSFVLAAVYAF